MPRLKVTFNIYATDDLIHCAESECAHCIPTTGGLRCKLFNYPLQKDEAKDLYFRNYYCRHNAKLT